MRRVGNSLLTIAAIGGVLCILFVLLAVFFHVTLIMFKTGSMSPTIPAGSLAVVREIPADTVRVGDVVTIDRTDALPITHRVTSATPQGGGLVSITMRGDANPSDDPAPYLVSSVRIVLFSVPQLAYAVVAVSNPIVLGAITVGAAGVVTWAFWPRDDTRPRPHGRRSVHRERAAHHARAASVAALLAVGVGAATLLPVHAAQAAVTEETISGSVLTLTSIGDRDAMRDLQAGIPVLWQVGIQANTPDSGTVTISLLGSGGLMTDAGGLWVGVRSCQVRWVGSSCASGASTLAAPTAASVLLASPLALGSMTTSEQRWILVEAFVPSASARGAANLSVMASGTGSTVVAGTNPGAMAHTGSDLQPAVQAALGAVLLGLALAFIARLRRRTVAT